MLIRTSNIRMLRWRVQVKKKKKNWVVCAYCHYRNKSSMDDEENKDVLELLFDGLPLPPLVVVGLAALLALASAVLELPAL